MSCILLKMGLHIESNVRVSKAAREDNQSEVTSLE
jgi:hypothetical protein